MSITTGFADFARGLRILFGREKTQDDGDKRLARLSRMVMGQIPHYGVAAVRSQVIRGVEDDLKRATKKSPEAVEALIQNALRTPEYMRLLHKLGLEEPHIRVMAKQAKKKGGENEQ